jgi:hypothetical protein
LIEEGSEFFFYEHNENPSHPPPPIRKWLLPNKVIGTKLQLVPVVEVCLYWPTPFLFPWIKITKLLKQYKDFNCYRLHVWNHSKLQITREIISKLRMVGHTKFEDDQLQIASWLEQNFSWCQWWKYAFTGPPPFYFLELRFISNTVTVVYLCVCWNLTAKRRYNDYLLYQDAICNWSSSNFVCSAILNFEIISHVIRSFEWFHACKR